MKVKNVLASAPLGGPPARAKRQHRQQQPQRRRRHSRPRAPARLPPPDASQPSSHPQAFPSPTPSDLSPTSTPQSRHPLEPMTSTKALSARVHAAKDDSFQAPTQSASFRFLARTSTALRRASIDGEEEGENTSNLLAMPSSSTSARPNWSRFVEARVLGKHEEALLRQYEKQQADSVAEILLTENTGAAYAEALLHVLSIITEPKVIEYTLGLVQDFLEPDIAERALFFVHVDGVGRSIPNIAPIARHLASEHPKVRERASTTLSLFLSLDSEPKAVLNEYVVWLVEQLRAHRNTPNHTSLRAAVLALTTLLANAEARAVFYRHSGVKLLSPLLEFQPGKNTQLLYETTLCMWMLSMCREASEDFTFKVIQDLAQLIADKPREKIVRVAIAALRSLITMNPAREQELSMWLQTTELERALQVLQYRDPDVCADIAFLRDTLESNYRVLSTVDRFSAELSSGRLKPGAIHKESFWKENVRSMEAEDFAAIRRLVAIIDEGAADPAIETDETLGVSLAVACSDLGFFTQYYPNGKKICDTLDAKSKVMRLLDCPNTEVQKQALLCVSKMLISQWQFIGAQPAAAGN